MNNKTRRILLSVIFISIIVLMSIGTYSFFTADITGNPIEETVVQTSGTLRIEYYEGQSINAEKVRPGWIGTKTFTVKNTGSLPAKYDVVFQDLVNTFKNEELIYRGTCISNQDSCANIEETILPNQEFFIKENIEIFPNEEHDYTLEIEFIETDENQDYNIQAILSGKTAIYETGSYEIVLIPQLQIASGAFHNLVLDERTGNLYEWGFKNDEFNLEKYIVTPTKISEVPKFTTISGGLYHSLALDEEGIIWSWGRNNYGQLGYETEDEYSSTPTQIMSGTKFTTIAAGGFHNLAIDEEGNLWAWGWNQFGQLGDGTSGYGTEEETPIQITDVPKFTTITAGRQHSLAIDEEGNLWGWGYNKEGQLGDNTTTYRSIPTQIMSGTKFKTISSGSYYSLAIDLEGNLWAWGSNHEGELGDGTTEDRTTPTKILGVPKFTTIAASKGEEYSAHTFAIDESGNSWSWGSNGARYLGIETEEDYITTPTKILGAPKFIAITGGEMQSLAIDNFGNLFTWGVYEFLSINLD